MKRFTTISQAEFDRKAEIAINLQPIRKEVPLGDIKLVSPETVMVSGKEIALSASGFDGLARMVGVNKQFNSNFEKNFGKDSSLALINRMSSALAVKGGTTTLVVNPTHKKIIGFKKDSKIQVSNKSFIEMARQAIDRHNLEVSNFSVNEDGNVVITASNPHGQWGIKGFKDEDFFGGVTFSNDFKEGLGVSPYLYRLVCANGMISKAFEESFTFSQIGSKEAENFVLRLNDLAKNGFRPAAFEDSVRKAANIRASMSEMEKVHWAIREYAAVDREVLEDWIPLKEVQRDYFSIGVDHVKMSNGQKANAPTNMTVWELVNALTNFASHEHGMGIFIEDYNRRILQKEAGALLSKKGFDVENLVPSPYHF
jgi:hypothetical protein